MPAFTCATCGTRFELAPSVLERYPGWTPRACRACRDRPGRNAAGAAADPVDLDDGVFTDGSAEPNPGRGGWGAVWVRGGEVVAERFGGEPDTTNNRMELRALIEGVRMVPEGTPVVVWSDSNLVVRTLNEWAAGWERRGWTRKTGPVQNLDLVREAFDLVRSRPYVEVRWIKAHAGHRWNEHADRLADRGRASA